MNTAYTRDHLIFVNKFEAFQVNEDIRDTDDEDDEGEKQSTAAGAAAAADNNVWKAHQKTTLNFYQQCCLHRL